MSPEAPSAPWYAGSLDGESGLKVGRDQRPRESFKLFTLLQRAWGWSRLFRNSPEPHPCDVQLPQRPPPGAALAPSLPGPRPLGRELPGADVPKLLLQPGERGCSPCSPPLTLPLAPQLGSSWGQPLLTWSPQAGPLPPPARGPCVIRTHCTPHTSCFCTCRPLLGRGTRCSELFRMGLRASACMPTLCFRSPCERPR